MKVILRDEVENLGQPGALVDVRAGYARNYLIPKQLAVEATTRNIKEVEHQKRLIADKIRKDRGAAEQQAAQLAAVTVTIPVRVGEEGKLFGSVTNKDIAEALAQQGFTVDKRKIKLENPIKEIGEFSVPVALPLDVVAQIKVIVEAQADIPAA